MSLCFNCQAIAPVLFSVHSLNDNPRIIYEHNVTSFFQSIASKCPLCSRYWSILSEENKEVVSNAPPSASIRCGTYNLFEENTKWLSFELQEDSLRRACEQFRLYKPNDWLNAGPIPQSLPKSTSHDLCWSLIRQWLENCQLEHPTCNYLKHPVQEAWLPTRLVDVGEPDSDIVRVITTAKLGLSQLHYLALSHCWGLKDFLVMNKTNSEMFQSGVSISKLPPNFRDAIYVTRKLGFGYIWIDSLCIIQGLDGDWQQEAPLMNMVYKNAVLTLAPIASSDAYGGFFRERDPELVLPYKFQKHQPLPSSSPASSRSSQVTHKHEILLGLVKTSFRKIKRNISIPQLLAHRAGLPKIWYAMPLNHWENGVTEMPLNKRAWVLQERVLSRRTVYFSKKQILWECRQLDACETFPPFPQKTMWQSGMARLKECNPDTILLPSVGNMNPDPYNHWETIVEEYSRCHLTKPGDKLVAISGLAKEFAQLLHDDYVAGLWRKKLGKGLLWCMSSDFSVRPDVYRAPTWSWASVDGPIYFPSISRPVQEYVDIIDVQVQPVSDDITGEIRSAVLHIRGYLLQICSDANSYVSYGRIDCLDTRIEVMEDRSLFLPVNIDQRNQLCGLILQPVSEAGDTAYKRIGILKIANDYEISKSGNVKKVVGQERNDHAWFDRNIQRVEISII